MCTNKKKGDYKIFMNILLFLTTATEKISETPNYEALKTQAILDLPVWQVIVLGVIASVLFIGVFMLIFMLISYIINFILIIIDKNYEKSGKKRPIRKHKH